MKKSVELLLNGFQSSTGLTPEFQEFYKTFKKEFTSELKSIGATDIKFSRGHFFVSGFFTFEDQAYYFTTGDVRGMDQSLKYSPESCQSKLMYRTVDNYQDYTGGMNRYATIRFGMIEDMIWFFKEV
jgi:hypothetical protein